MQTKVHTKIYGRSNRAAHIFFGLPLVRAFLYNLPLWIKMSAQIRIVSSKPWIISSKISHWTRLPTKFPTKLMASVGWIFLLAQKIVPLPPDWCDLDPQKNTIDNLIIVSMKRFMGPLWPKVVDEDKQSCISIICNSYIIYFRPGLRPLIITFITCA